MFGLIKLKPGRHHLEELFEPKSPRLSKALGSWRQRIGCTSTYFFQGFGLVGRIELYGLGGLSCHG
jgi:hypothetical protein